MDAVRKRPRYQIINGVRNPAFFSPKCFTEAMNYKPTPEDVFIVTYPKCGTTWMQTIALYIFRKGRELENLVDFYRMSPFIDVFGKEGIDNMPRPGAMKTHLPYNQMPYSPNAKYIFVVRDPRDCCVSMFYHTRDAVEFGFWDAEFDDFFELFMVGEVEYNDYYDHILSLYPHRNDAQVFFTKYEDMKKDTKKIILDLAKFLGTEYINAIEKDNAVLNNILRLSSFDHMKKFWSHHRSKPDTHTDTDSASEKIPEAIKYIQEFMKSVKIPENPPEKHHLRKGIVGDWKNHFSTEQTKRFVSKFLERTEGTEIQDWYLMNE